MNFTPYVFGVFNNGYTQYPNDYTNTILQNFRANSKSTTQIAIHRESNLMYYGYVRKLEQEKYIGFCIVINGIMITNINQLFLLFENIISNLVTDGQLIQFNEQGKIVINTGKVIIKSETIAYIFEFYRAYFQSLKDFVQPLPPINYGVSKDSVKNFSIEDDINKIIKSSYTYGFTFIYKSKDFNTSQLNGYQGILKRLNNERLELTKRYDNLVRERNEIIRQKKQYQFVAILFLLLLGCGIGIITLKDNLNKTSNDLIEANKNIATKSDSIKKLILMYNTKDKLLDTSQASLMNLQNLIEKRQPLIIKSTSFDFNTGYLSFSYYGLKNESMKIQVRAYSDDGPSYSNFQDVYIQLKDSYDKIYLSKYLDSTKWYSFEILKGDTILGGDRH